MAKKGKEKDAAAVSLGARGGKARARNLSKKQLSAIGRKASLARWSKKPTKGGE
jgi:hypothetical protein